MTDKNVFKKNRNFYIGIAGTVVEGLLSGSLFLQTLNCTFSQLFQFDNFQVVHIIRRLV